ncbi:hypothetical protein LNQ81_11780 [Myroides sp. M-43]|uniref:DUF6850 family outer membrane beta-barrel protein n=1 Tax=Myroides oncorhynchi TaxID=2893756 RepID=UPI001E5E9B4B|nr:DUF6850 family outer membrane beta-barrel protein [Myroides oncorhynchi]MCC9043350.1 hypothetical protein [Myroides oncorhynchi]
MRKLYIFITLFLIQMLNAQNHSEHLDLWLIQKNKRSYVPEHILFLNNQTSEFGRLAVDYNNTKGDYKKSQEANDSKDFKFSAEGYTDIYKFKAYGNFVYGKTFENELANDLRGKKDEFNPYYFYANHPNNFQNQQYLANTMFSYELVNKKLTIGFGLDFDYNWTTGNNDPRPDVVNYFIRYKADIAWKIQKHAIGLGVAYGKVTEENNIMYKNNQYKSSNQYKDRFLNISLGYGDIVLSDQNLLLDRKAKENSYKLAHLYTGDKLEVATFAKITHYDENSELNKYKQSFDVYNRFKNKQLTVQSMLTYTPSDANQYQLSLKYNNYDGKNLREIEGLNYKVDHYNFNTQLLTSFTNLWKDTDIQIGLDHTLYSTIRKDYAIGVYSDEKQLLNKLIINTIFKHESHFYQISATPLYKLKLVNDLTIPDTQHTNFTDSVIIPNYYYNNNNAWGLQGEVGYGNKTWLNQYSLYFSVSGHFLKSNGLDRSSINLSLKLYL